MSRITYTELRQNLARYLDEAVQSRAPIVVTRQSGRGNMVMLFEEEFAGWQEAVHLLANPANARRLLRSVHAADAGATHKRQLGDRENLSTGECFSNVVAAR